jgi:catalase
MSGLVPESVQKMSHAVLGPREGDKLKDLAHATKDMNPHARLTTDYGVKQSTADDWLKAASPDKAGPLLLEDPFARERVRFANSQTPSVIPC